MITDDAVSTGTPRCWAKSPARRRQPLGQRGHGAHDQLGACAPTRTFERLLHERFDRKPARTRRIDHRADASARLGRQSRFEPRVVRRRAGIRLLLCSERRNVHTEHQQRGQ
jgi:hypothetical protein